eukprot:6488218-Amphidinium_carterae.1
MASFDVAEGRISYYEAKGIFEARCSWPSHNTGGITCKLTRTCRCRKKGRDGLSLGGRPVAFLLCWLRHASACSSKAQHWMKEDWERIFTLQARQACRSELESTSEGQALLACERELEAGEPSEPETLAGLLH